MDKAKILRLCADIEKSLPNLCLTIFYRERDELIEKLKVIAAEVSAKPKTNADRIRQMTDEELASFLRNFDMCIACQVECTRGFPCYKGIMEWLKQEADADAGTD